MFKFKLCLFISLVLSVACYGKKVAYVIGNNDYQYSGILNNAKNDSVDVSAVLKQNGFKVLNISDASEKDMNDGLAHFSKEGVDSDVCIFFFSGHGFQIGDQNYLVPVDGRLTRDPNKSMISLKKVLKSIDSTKAKLKIVILDCCRNNPFENVPGGLASVSESNFPTGTLIVYAGAPGKTVPDGLGRNSPFTTELLNQLQPGRDCLTLFTSVAAARYTYQDPWIKFDGSGTTLSLLRSYDLLGSVGEGGVINKPSASKPSENTGDLYKLTSLWDHNGSTMGLLTSGNKRVIVYVRVREGLIGYVEPGTVLFDGYSKGGKYIGKARRFSIGLPPIQYEVSGPILKNGSEVLLKGKAPIRGEDGKVSKYIDDELRFTYERLAQ